VMKRLRMIPTQVAVLLVLTVASVKLQANEFDAVLIWPETYVVNFPMDGSIARVNVRPGQKVDKGTRLIELDPEPYEIRVRQHRAELSAAEPVLADAKRLYEQAQSLYEQTLLSDDELQRARHAYERAGAELAASRARLDYAQWRLKKAIVRAPWDGWIVQRQAEPGQMLVAEQRSKPLLVLAKSEVMAARAEVPLSDVDAVDIGQSVTVKAADQTWTARITALTLLSDPAGKPARYRLDAAFRITPTDVLAPGQAATIRLR